MNTHDEDIYKIEGKWEYLREGYSPYFTDNPREAVWMANKYGGIIIDNHSDDERECIKDGSKWRVSARRRCTNINAELLA